jgi:type II secretory pathway pseudopilin PulG
MRRDQGSVLVETLVATAIVTMMTAALYGALGDAAERARAAEARRAALLVAQSALAGAPAAGAFRTGRVTGADGPYVWEIVASPQSAAPSASGRLVRLEVRVRRQDAPDVLARLSTLRLAGAA